MNVATPPVGMWVLWEVRRFNDEELGQVIECQAEPVAAILWDAAAGTTFPVPVSQIGRSHCARVIATFIASNEEEVDQICEGVIGYKCRQCGEDTCIRGASEYVLANTECWTGGTRYLTTHNERCTIWAETT